jgi:hypothetical protein
LRIMTWNKYVYTFSTDTTLVTSISSLQFIKFTEGFTLEKHLLYCLSHTSSTFCSGYFGDGPGRP